MPVEGKHSIKDFGQEALNAEILGKITGKGWDTDLAQRLMEKSAAIVPGTATTAVG